MSTLPPCTPLEPLVRSPVAAPLDGSGLGIQPFVLELRVADGQPAQTELVVLQREASAVTETASVIAVFPGRAEFAYVNRDGRATSDWPALARKPGDAEDLPRVVQVRDASSEAVLMLYAFQGETTQPTVVRSPFGGAP